jgi:hypothetical protein
MPSLLKRSLVAFWAAWLSIVFLTNAADAAKTLGLLNESWAFVSGNYRFVSETTARYGLTPALNGLLFAGVILWEGAAAALFWRAAFSFSRSAIYSAFGASLLLWAAFLLADEFFIAYAVEGTHLRLFTAQLVTLVAIELLPANVEEKSPGDSM